MKASEVRGSTFGRPFFNHAVSVRAIANHDLIVICGHDDRSVGRVCEEQFLIRFHDGDWTLCIRQFLGLFGVVVGFGLHPRGLRRKRR